MRDVGLADLRLQISDSLNPDSNPPSRLKACTKLAHGNALGMGPQDTRVVGGLGRRALMAQRRRIRDLREPLMPTRLRPRNNRPETQQLGLQEAQRLHQIPIYRGLLTLH